MNLNDDLKSIFNRLLPVIITAINTPNLSQ